MIEKKTSPSSEFTGDEPLDAMDPLDHDRHAAAVDDDGEDNGEADAEAMIASQKRKGLILTYGTGAAFLLAVGLVTYPHFKRQFFASPSVAPVAAGTSMPVTVRKNYFPDAGKNHSPDVSNPASLPSTTDTDITSLKPDLPATAPTAVLPPPEVPPAPPVPSNSAPSSDLEHVPPANPVTTSPTLQSLNILPTPAPEADDKGVKEDIEQLRAANQAQSTQLQQLQATVTELQKQVTDLATVKPRDVPVAPAAARHSAVAPGQSKWQLRSAVQGMALLGRSNSSELKRVSVGDMVSGLGKVTSITEQDGHWVVEATGGSISQ